MLGARRVLGIQPIPQRFSLQQKFVGHHVFCWFVETPYYDIMLNPPRKDCDYVLCDLILHLENILQVAVKPLGPKVFSGICRNELSRDSNSIPSFSNTATDQILHAKLACNFTVVQLRISEFEGRIAGNNKHRSKPGQSGDDVL